MTKTSDEFYYSKKEPEVKAKFHSRKMLEKKNIESK